MQNTSCLFLCLVLAVTVLVPVSGVNCAVSVSGVGSKCAVLVLAVTVLSGVGSNCAVSVSGVGSNCAVWHWQ